MDEQEFTRKLLSSEQMLYRIACAMLRSPEDRQDAMQETALKAWKSRLRLREDRYFTTWLTRILLNECKALHRKNARMVPMENLAEQRAPEKDMELRMLLERLPEKQRIPLVLHYLEGFSLEEIARVQHAPLGTVKYRLHQARKALRVEMEGKGEAEK
ncbi:MAG: sigma-70 family RNA polymerase sigma factor [Clostridia bacterium]|nr:sigma-70 family RNA polymerase sigma factor [Clostridia bacterium]